MSEEKTQTRRQNTRASLRLRRDFAMFATGAAVAVVGVLMATATFQAFNPPPPPSAGECVRGAAQRTSDGVNSALEYAGKRWKEWVEPLVWRKTADNPKP